MRTVFVAIAITVVQFALSVRAAEDLMIWGLGGASCAKYAKVFKENPDRAQEALIDWAQGFMSGLNVGLQNANMPTRNLSGSTENLANMVMAGCDQRPLALVLDLVRVYFEHLPLSNYRKPAQ